MIIHHGQSTGKASDTQPFSFLSLLYPYIGPFFIKLGQALSIRPDILSPRAMVELQRLCDKVPSFDNKMAMDTIESQLGKPVDELFSELSANPVGTCVLG